MKKLITILLTVLGVSAFALGPNELQINTGSDTIDKVIHEERDYKIVLEVDTEFYDPDWKATEESVENSIKMLRAIAKVNKWDGWSYCWALHNTKDSSKSSRSYKRPEMNKCVAAENGRAIDLILNFVAPQDIEEAEKLLKAGYYTVTLLVVTDLDGEIAALKMYNNCIWVGIWTY